MWFWWFMFVFNLFLPILLILCGYFMKDHCPKEINSILGYRTRRSMRNQETWQFANTYCGALWQKIGCILLLPTILIQIPFYHQNDDTVGLLGGILVSIQIAFMFVSIYLTERALKKKFE